MFHFFLLTFVLVPVIAFFNVALLLFHCTVNSTAPTSNLRDEALSVIEFLTAFIPARI